MLVFCQVGDPLALWGKYWDSLVEDIKGQIGREFNNVQHIMDIFYNCCLALLEDVFSMSGHILQHFGLHRHLENKELLQPTVSI